MRNARKLILHVAFLSMPALHHQLYEISHLCVFLIIAASLRLLIALIASAEISALESPTI